MTTKCFRRPSKHNTAASPSRYYKSPRTSALRLPPPLESSSNRPPTGLGSRDTRPPTNLSCRLDSAHVNERKPPACHTVVICICVLHSSLQTRQFMSYIRKKTARQTVRELNPSPPIIFYSCDDATLSFDLLNSKSQPQHAARV